VSCVWGKLPVCVTKLMTIGVYGLLLTRKLGRMVRRIPVRVVPVMLLLPPLRAKKRPFIRMAFFVGVIYSAICNLRDSV